MKLISQRDANGEKNGLRGTLGKNDKAASMGDKSISHRALMFAGMARGTSRITGLLESEDTQRTQKTMAAMGVMVKKDGDDYLVESPGFLALRQPKEPLDMGNSGTSARLLMGMLSGTGHHVSMFGDESLSKRPMKRVIGPLSNMGVEFTGSDNALPNFLPLSFRGRPPLIPLDYTLPVASAQIKSAILLAGLSAMGDTTVWEHNISRDHTERMLALFGVPLRETIKDNLRGVTIGGGTAVLEKITGKNINVPRDISSVAFLLVAASILPDSDLTIENVGLNPTRDGIIETLLEMGAAITIDYDGFAAGGEPTGTIRVKSAALQGITTPPDRAPRMIDEYPILSIAAACATGVSLFQGLEELRVKESNRLAAIATGLSGAGVAVKTGDDWLEITGQKNIRGGNVIATNLDHRIAMSFYILGLVCQEAITIDDDRSIATSFPNFLSLMSRLLNEQ
ncbi:MAG: 3-phosphoshikimate 1-carboxyvinyltransferase [Hydrotalea sp.]|nr:3-phosphoshikimate 1-carboxyvinyltransferase [Hydrotalea sp.]